MEEIKNITEDCDNKLTWYWLKCVLIGVGGCCLSSLAYVQYLNWQDPHRYEKSFGAAAIFDCVGIALASYAGILPAGLLFCATTSHKKSMQTSEFVTEQEPVITNKLGNDRKQEIDTFTHKPKIS